MKKYMLTIIVLVSIFTPIISHSSAILLETKGKVELKLPSGSSPSPAIGLELPDKSSLSTKAASHATIMFSSGSIDKIGPLTTYTVGADKKNNTKSSLIKGLAIAMKEATSDSENAIAHGMVKMTRLGPGSPTPPSGGKTVGIRLDTPKETSILYKPSVEFRWDGNGLNWGNPALIIDDKDSKRLRVIPLKTLDSKFVVTNKMVNWKRGERYSWYLAEKNGADIRGRTPRTNFYILPLIEENKTKGEISELGKLNLTEKTARDFLTAQIYYNHKLYSDAVKLLRPIWNKNQTEGLRLFLFSAYQKMSINEETVNFAPEKRD